MQPTGEFGSPRPACGERSETKSPGEGDSPRASQLQDLRRRPLTPTLSPRRAGRGRRKKSARFAHAFAETLDQSQHPRRPAVAVAAQYVHDPKLDGVDHRGRPGAQLEDILIE